MSQNAKEKKKKKNNNNQQPISAPPSAPATTYPYRLISRGAWRGLTSWCCSSSSTSFCSMCRITVMTTRMSVVSACEGGKQERLLLNHSSHRFLSFSKTDLHATELGNDADRGPQLRQGHVRQQVTILLSVCKTAGDRQVRTANRPSVAQHTGLLRFLALK